MFKQTQNCPFLILLNIEKGAYCLVQINQSIWYVWYSLKHQLQVES